MTRLEDNQKHNNSSNQVKEIATDKNVQGDNYRHSSYHLKKARQEDFYKITWQIVIMAAMLQDGLLNLSKEVFPTDKYCIKMVNFWTRKQLMPI